MSIIHPEYAFRFIVQGNIKYMKENKRKIIHFLIIIQILCLCSCRKERVADNEFVTLNVVIQNKSKDTYYFNTIDIEHPSCGIVYKDDDQKLKEFHFSFNADLDEVKYDMTMQPSSFSYALKPSENIEFTVKLMEGINDYYKIVFDEERGSISRKFLGKTNKTKFFVLCSLDPFSYNSHYSDYSRKIKEFGIELEGKQTEKQRIEFVIN